MKEHSTSRLGPKGLMKLLSMGVGREMTDDDRSPDEEKEALFRDWLAGELPPALKGPQASATAPSVLTLREALLGKETSLALLKAIKDCFRGISEPEKDSARHTVGLSIYYAAISSALVFHGSSITRMSPRKLEEGLTKLLAKPWVPAEIRGLFEGAREMCRHAAESTGDWSRGESPAKGR